jgi:hypothetical protein
MTLEPLAQLVQSLERRVCTPPDAIGEAADASVVIQHRNDQRVIRVHEARARGQQNLLLLSEVLPPVLLPIGQEPSAGGRRGGLVGAL